MLRKERHSLLAVADQHRWYMTGLLEYARRVPPLKAVVFAGTPAYMGAWGIEGAVHLAFGIALASGLLGTTGLPTASAQKDPPEKTSADVVKGMLRTRNELQSHIRFTDEAPKSQFGEGWSGADDGAHRWISSKADVTLYRPAESKGLEIVASGPTPADVTVLEDGHTLGTRQLSEARVQTLRWGLDPGASGNKKITIDTHDSRIAIESFGYVSP